ncbi:MAG: M48 family metallopeptidase [Verrucomicrobia bacterium]|nr:M48 family metallopeptidase [Verrucomicrobiota bacterium]MDA1086341.1 M48 family metallopeptidase [Verrucomicrobiota bacterium]
MAMDFFQHQDVARRKTGLLITYFILAVILIIASIYVACSAAIVGVKVKANNEIDWASLWNFRLFVWVAGITISIVVIGSLSKIAGLAEGGKAVAEQLGGRRLDPGTTNVKERRLLNVVEEIAIAAGTPVPPVFLLNESAINAFAAGFSLGDAVIGVTEGCMTRLSRAELQGVLAHEFSHILNGDMRINIRLIGILHGILVIGMVGYFIFRSTMFTSHRRSSNRSEGNQLPLVLLGLAIFAIGYIGVFFGKLIKAAISRQREFLADASAVQFTRDPDGIAGALKRIGGYASGSRIQHPNAEQASHLFFSNALNRSFVQLLATHPPLPERIRRIEGTFDGEMIQDAAQNWGDDETAAVAAFAPSAPHPSPKLDAVPERVLASVGTLDAEHIAYAGEMRRRLPSVLVDAAHEAYGARAVVYAVLLHRDPSLRSGQLARLEAHADAAVFGEALRLAPTVDALDRHLRLPLVDIAIPALRMQTMDQYTAFEQNVQHLIEADGEIDLFEYCLRHVMARHVEPNFITTAPSRVRFRNLVGILPQCAQLLSSLAYFGHDEVAVAERAYASSVASLPPGNRPDLLPISECSLDAVDSALETLAEASPQIKKTILGASIACVAADGRATLEEAELIRSIADAMDCPVPPLLPAASA